MAKVKSKTTKKVAKKKINKKKNVASKKNILKKRFKLLLKNIVKIKKNITKKIKKHSKKVVKKNTIVKSSLKNRRAEVDELARIQEELDNKKEIIEDRELKKKNLIKAFLSLIIISFIVSLVILVLTYKDESGENKFNEIDLLKYKEVYNSKELSFIYITESNCTYCELLDPSIIKLEDDYGIDFKVLNISNLNKSEKEELVNSNSIFEEGWKAPLLISVKDGRDISSIKGYKEYEVLKKFVEYSQNPLDNNSFIKININKYLSIMNSSDLSVIYIGRSNSKSCEIFSPILEEVAIEEEITVYYLNTDTLDTSEEWDKLTNSNDIFKEDWFVPTIIVTKDGKIINYKMETLGKDSLISFFKKSGI